jgi:hypothetical protein
MGLFAEHTVTHAPDAGTVKEAHCGVCKSNMKVTRNLYSKAGRLGSDRYYDWFECEHKDEVWHKQLYALEHEFEKTPSATLAALYRKEINGILESHRPTKTEFDSF